MLRFLGSMPSFLEGVCEGEETDEREGWKEREREGGISLTQWIDRCI